MNISRRDAIRGMGATMIGAAAASMCSFAYAAEPDSVSWDKTADVIVVGAGGAGDMAALDCSEEGDLSVIILESLETPLASSHLCGGDLVFCETDMAPGSRDDLYNDLLAAAQNDCQEGLLRSYVDTAPDVYKMLTDWGVTFYKTAQVAYMSQAWEHVPDGDSGTSIMSVLEDRIASDSNIQLLTSCHGHKLVLDTDGNVIGVEVESNGDVEHYGASHGVIITSGGFSQNHMLAKAFGRKGSEYITPMTGKGATGDGLLMGLAAGADASYLGAGVTPTGPIGYESTTNCGLWMTCGAIMVGLDGKRFHNEGDNYVLITQAAMNLPGATFFQIYDTPMRKVLEDYDGLAIFGLPLEPEMTGDTLDDLGAAIAAKYEGFDAATLVQTVTDYNGYVASGVDEEFGRTNISGTTGDLQPIETGPFYAVACLPGTTHFNGGLKTDDSQRVVNALGGDTPIVGLYAAGEVTGGFHGYGYMSGTAFGKALVHGVVAARTLISDVADGGAAITAETASILSGSTASSTSDSAASASASGSASASASVSASKSSSAFGSASASASAAAGSYKDGTYTGTGTGMGGKINVTLEISGGKITVTDISPNNETKGIGGYEAIEDGTFKSQIEAAQSADIEGVSGASVTSAAIKKAVQAALDQAAA